MPGSFISYCRHDASLRAPPVEELRRGFGAPAVFIDVGMLRESTSPLSSTARSGPVGCSWRSSGRDGRMLATSTDTAASNDPDDFVRIEIATALDRPDVIVIPVLVDDVEIPAASALPASLVSLDSYNWLSFRFLLTPRRAHAATPSSSGKRHHCRTGVPCELTTLGRSRVDEYAGMPVRVRSAARSTRCATAHRRCLSARRAARRDSAALAL